MTISVKLLHAVRHSGKDYHAGEVLSAPVISEYDATRLVNLGAATVLETVPPSPPPKASEPSEPAKVNHTATAPKPHKKGGK